MTELEDFLRKNLRHGLRVNFQPYWFSLTTPGRDEFLWLCIISDWENGFATWSADGPDPVQACYNAFQKMHADKRPRFPSAKRVGRRAT